jgi:hypothetical protein
MDQKCGERFWRRRAPFTRFPPILSAVHMHRHTDLNQPKEEREKRVQKAFELLEQCRATESRLEELMKVNMRIGDT